MHTQKSRLYMACAFTLAAIFFATLAPAAHAQSISQEQLEEQHRAVLLEIVDVLREDVKLLQMLLIRNLEARIETLQAQVDAQDS